METLLPPRMRLVAVELSLVNVFVECQNYTSAYHHILLRRLVTTSEMRKFNSCISWQGLAPYKYWPKGPAITHLAQTTNQESSQGVNAL